MRTYNPNDKSDREEARRHLAEPWMLEMLKANPHYVFWGPHEDYMWKDDNDKHGWETSIKRESWKKFDVALDDLNEIVNFYFHIERDSEKCRDCNGTGYHPDALWVSENFYHHSSPFSAPTGDEVMARAVMAGFGSDMSDALPRGSYPPEETIAKYGQRFRDFCLEMQEHGAWNGRPTQDELQALWDHGRLRPEFKQCPTVEEMVGFEKKGMGHDAINRMIMIEARLKRLGLPKTCPKCEGHGYVWTAPAARLCLTLWLIHPRKGASRGVEIANVEREDVPKAVKFLKQAAARNAKRFSKLGRYPVDKEAEHGQEAQG